MKTTHLITLTLAALAIAGCAGNSTLQPQQTPKASKDAVMQSLQRGLTRSGVLGSQQSRTAKTRNHQEDHHFNESLGLWVEPVFGSVDDPTAPSGERYWVDEASTIPGGHHLMVMSDPGVYPLVFRDELEYLEGNFKGVWERVRIEWREDESGTLTAAAFSPAEGTFEYGGTWDVAGTGTWNGRFTALDGAWDSYALVRRSDNTATWTLSGSTGITVTLDYRADGAGTGTITGSGEGLPATIAWDAEGNGTITWSDGTTTPIEIYLF